MGVVIQPRFGQHLTVQQELSSGQNMLIKTTLLSLLFLAPAILTFKLNAPQSPESELARQFNDDPVINYGIWGFIAGLTDYFVRNGFTTTTTPAPATRRTASKVNFRKKQQDKKQKQEKKEKKEKKRLEREEKKQKKKAEKEMENMKEQEEKKEESVVLADEAEESAVEEAVEA